MLFSDNISLALEKQIKTLAHSQQRLVMGPDCGTAIINGMPLGFANVVRRGAIGVVGASGTGMQEITCRIDQLAPVFRKHWVPAATICTKKSVACPCWPDYRHWRTIPRPGLLCWCPNRPHPQWPIASWRRPASRANRWSCTSSAPTRPASRHGHHRSAHAGACRRGGRRTGTQPQASRRRSHPERRRHAHARCRCLCIGAIPARHPGGLFWRHFLLRSAIAVPAGGPRRRVQYAGQGQPADRGSLEKRRPHAG